MQPALVIYDHILTFTEEIRKIWSRRFTLASIIFLSNRYMSLAGYIVVMNFFVSNKVSKCAYMIMLDRLTYHFIVNQNTVVRSLWCLSDSWLTINPDIAFPSNVDCVSTQQFAKFSGSLVLINQIAIIGEILSPFFVLYDY